MSRALLRRGPAALPQRLPFALHPRTYTDGKKPLSPHYGFYKSFGRPLAKVFLMSVAVYQIAYMSWVKLEKDEEARDKTADIEALENRLKDLAKSKS